MHESFYLYFFTFSQCENQILGDCQNASLRVSHSASFL